MDAILSKIDSIIPEEVSTLKDVYKQYLILEDFLHSEGLEAEFELTDSDFVEPEDEEEVVFVIPVHDNENYLSFIYSKYSDKYIITIDFVEDPSIFVHDLDDTDE